MSDNEGTPSDGKAIAWTEEAKYQFLLRIVAQLKDDGKTINWQKINMPGRTTKSLQNMWTKVNKSIADLEGQGDSTPGTPVKTPSKKGTPRKPRAKKSEVIVKDGQSDEETSPGKKPTKKRNSGAAAAAKAAKKAKTDHDDEETEANGTEPLSQEPLSQDPLGIDSQEATEI